MAVAIEHIEEAIDPEARLLQVLRHKGDQEGESAGIMGGPLFRRLQVRRYKSRAAVRGRLIDSISG